jgi:hypothetical protein
VFKQFLFRFQPGLFTLNQFCFVELVKLKLVVFEVGPVFFGFLIYFMSGAFQGYGRLGAVV